MGLISVLEKYINIRIHKQGQSGEIDSEKATKTRESLNYFIESTKSLQESLKSNE